MGGYNREERVASTKLSTSLLVAIFIVLTLLGVGLYSVRLGGGVLYPLLSICLDGGAAALVVGIPALAGLWLVPLFRLGPIPLRWHLLLGAALGLGSISLLLLLCGLAGLLQRPVWNGVMLILLLAGVTRLHLLLTRPAAERETPHDGDPTTAGAFRLLWLLAAPFLSLALLAAINAPGSIWMEEGFGYDVLEYHLQLPKEYHDAGRITYLPHNVYANFPANVEMLYLLAMILLDEDVDAGVTANMIHAILALLTVFGTWVAGREWSPKAGVLAGVSMASAGWLAYLSGLAYVENGMLFFGVVAVAALLRLVTAPNDVPPAASEGLSPDSTAVPPGSTTGAHQKLGWPAASGAIAGFACGCKYTAMAMIAFPLGVAALLLPIIGIRRKMVSAATVGLAALLTFSPWLIKNRVLTGNPVFPLANTLFEGSPEGWSEIQTAQWDRAHSPLEHQDSLGARLRLLWTRVLRDKYGRVGPLILLLALGSLVVRRWDRADGMLLTLLLIQLAVWMLATHLFARFVVVLLIPLAILAGRITQAAGSPGRWGLIMALVIIGGTFNFDRTAERHRQESPGGMPASFIYEGRLPGADYGEAVNSYEYFDVVNNQLPADVKILLVGDARAFYFMRNVDYCVVFNKDPFVEAIRAAKGPADVVDWLRDKGYTHVLVHWSEISRLAQTYGFAPEVNPATFEQLSDNGLSLVRAFPHPQGRGLYVSLYQVPGGED